MRRFAPALFALLPAAGPQGVPPGCPDASKCAINIRAEEIKWGKIFPDMGPDGPEISVLRVDPKTQATALMIRTPKAMPVPWHWHSSNETHTVIQGTFTVECEGKKAELGPGSFNYLPARSIHRAWTSEGCYLFINVDGAWDLNWVEGPPNRPAPPQPASGWNPDELRFEGLVIEAIEISGAQGHQDGRPSKRVEDAPRLKRILSALKPGEGQPSEKSPRWVLNLYAGKGGLYHQVWVLADGQWGFAGQAKGGSNELVRCLTDLGF